jgi:hypothetical protein
MRCVRSVAAPTPTATATPTSTVSPSEDTTVTIEGLMWQKTDDGKRKNWDDAKSYCEGSSFGGNSGWRLPTLDEFDLILDKTKIPTIDIIKFPETKSSPYWVSDVSSAFYAWFLSFDDGYSGDANKSTNYYVRCVRSTSGTTPPKSCCD